MKYIPKSFLITLFIILSGYEAYPQSNEPYIYGELGGGKGTHDTYKAALNGIFRGRNVISLSYYYSLHRAPNIPSDYNPNGLFGTWWPQQTVSMFGLSYGCSFFLNNPFIRFIVKGGVCEGKVGTPVNFVVFPSGGWGSGYTYSTKNDIVTGLLLDPSVEFPLSREFGFSIGLYANVNPVNSVFGLDASMIFGKLRGKNKKHPSHRML